MLYLICVCLALPAVMSLTGFMAMLLWGRKDGELKIAECENDCNKLAEKVAERDNVRLTQLESELKRLQCHTANKVSNLPASLTMHSVEVGSQSDCKDET